MFCHMFSEFTNQVLLEKNKPTTQQRPPMTGIKAMFVTRPTRKIKQRQLAKKRNNAMRTGSFMSGVESCQKFWKKSQCSVEERKSIWVVLTTLCLRPLVGKRPDLVTTSIEKLSLSCDQSSAMKSPGKRPRPVCF